MTDDLHHEIEKLDRRVIALESTRGFMRLSPPTLFLVWSVFLTILGVAAMVLHTEWQQAEQGKAIVAISTKLDTHVAAPGHAISMERLTQMQITLNEVKTLLEQHIDRNPRR